MQFISRWLLAASLQNGASEWGFRTGLQPGVFDTVSLRFPPQLPSGPASAVAPGFLLAVSPPELRCGWAVGG